MMVIAKTQELMSESQGHLLMLVVGDVIILYIIV